MDGSAGSSSSVDRDANNPGAREAGGAEPDYRFTLANERTFLAWTRTGLALVAGGVAVGALLDRGVAARTLGAVVVLLGTVVAGAAYRHWRSADDAIRTGGPLPASRLPLVLTVGVVVVAVATLGLVVVV